MSVGKKSTLKTYYMTRNRVLFMRRNTTGLKKMAWVFFFLLFSLPKNAATYIVKREADHSKAFWKGLLWNLTHLPNGEKVRLFT